MAAAAPEKSQREKDIEEKGWDPSIPLEERSEAEKAATIDAHNKPVGTGRKASEAAKAVNRGPEARKVAREKAASARMDKAVAALEKAKGPMHNRDLADAIKESYDPFYLWLKGHPEVFVRTSPGAFDLKSRNPKGEQKPLRLANGKEKPVKAPAAKAPAKAKASKGKRGTAKASSSRQRATAASK